MATGVGRGRIWLASFNNPTPKTLCWTQRSPRYLVYKLSYSRIYFKFRCHGNLVGSFKISLTSLDSLIPKTSSEIYRIQAEL